jgi:hypothetical protein
MNKVPLLAVAFLCWSGMVSGSRQDGNRDLPGTYAIGDGNILLYGKESNILQFFGPPYSSPSILHLALQGNLKVSSSRISGTDIWHHQILNNGIPICRETDFVSAETESFIREIDADEDVAYNLDITLDNLYLQYNNLVKVVADTVNHAFPALNNSYTIQLQPGIPFYHIYLSPRGYTYRIMVTGSAKLVPVDETSKKFHLLISRGRSSLLIVAGPSLSDVNRHIKALADSKFDKLLKNIEEQWKKFTDKLTVFKKENYPAELISAIDDISILLKSQQSNQGVVMAGYSWHMGYVRDQYGAFRGLMAMGLYDEARQTLNFFYDVWKANGIIHNAQAIGYPGIFHCHENDEVEITGYLMLQAFQYYEKTKDGQFIEKIIPMLEWAMQVQIKNLIDGMLPFNGDETYIAGGVLPRKAMYNGSAEATLLFIEGSNKLLDFVVQRKLWDKSKIQDYQIVVEDCMRRYRQNFFRNGVLYANNIEREQKVIYPQTRSGVCLHPEHPVSHHIRLYHFKGPLYFCEDCIKKDNSKVQIPFPEVFDIPSVGLFPLYIDSKLFTDQEKKELLDIVVKRYRSTGKIAEQNMIMGHDYGMFLTALVRANHPLQDEIYRKIMSLRDNTGSWCEYYIAGDKPFGTAWHPWSAGTNIEAAILCAQRNKNK